MGTVIAVGVLVAVVIAAAIALWRAGSTSAEGRAARDAAELGRATAEANLRAEQDYAAERERLDQRAGADVATARRDGADAARLRGWLLWDADPDAPRADDGDQAGPTGTA